MHPYFDQDLEYKEWHIYIYTDMISDVPNSHKEHPHFTSMDALFHMSSL